MAQTGASVGNREQNVCIEENLFHAQRRFNKSAGFWLVAVNFELRWLESNKISVESKGDGIEGGDFL